MVLMMMMLMMIILLIFMVMISVKCLVNFFLELVPHSMSPLNMKLQERVLQLIG